MNHGIIQIGYEINGEIHYVIQRNNGIVIGAYGITNNERSKHIYRCKTEVEGYFIRKEQWLDALHQNSIIAKKIKSNLFTDNYFKINLKIQAHKAKSIKLLL